MAVKTTNEGTDEKLFYTHRIPITHALRHLLIDLFLLNIESEELYETLELKLFEQILQILSKIHLKVNLMTFHHSQQ